MKKIILFTLAVATLIIMAFFAASGSNGQQLVCLACCSKGVVDKTPCETFIVKIYFKNTGQSVGTWYVNIAFEGELWTWSGIPQILTLESNQRKTLTWNGTVPCDAPIGSVARLIVYYNDSFTALDWWIHVVPNAELTITSSAVE
ncbi:MAG: hypothetical protein QW468_02370 [Candidatus Bathyarchaeia archaeon]